MEQRMEGVFPLPPPMDNRAFRKKTMKRNLHLHSLFAVILLCVLACLSLTGCASKGYHLDDAVLWPTLPHNVYCEEGHETPDFTEEQVLLVRPLRSTKKKITSKVLVFPDGARTTHTDDTCLKLNQLLESGEYRIIVYDRSEEKLKNPLKDHPWTRTLRTYAIQNGIPLAILYGTDDSAAILPGIPQGIRQYWQCPDCAKKYSKQQKEAAKAEWEATKQKTANLLLFPLNLVPDMLAGIFSHAGECFHAIYTQEELGWFVFALPFTPFLGIADGAVNAWNGRPCWNMDLTWKGKKAEGHSQKK